MLFFKRILSPKAAEAPSDRRGETRFAIGPRFPVKVVLNIVGRDEQGQMLKPSDGAGWDWTGRLINLSRNGARLQVPSTVHAHKGDLGHLKLDLEGYELPLAVRIVHISERYDSFIYGLSLDPISDAGTQQAFAQLLDLVALGAALRPGRPCQPDGTGHLVEQYVGEDNCVLTIWRELVGRTISAFDFQLKGCRVQGTAGKPELHYFIGDDPQHAHPAAPNQITEIHRLFHWVIPNIPSAVPADVRQFLAPLAGKLQPDGPRARSA